MSSVVLSKQLSGPTASKENPMPMNIENIDNAVEIQVHLIRRADESRRIINSNTVLA